MDSIVVSQAWFAAVDHHAFCFAQNALAAASHARCALALTTTADAAPFYLRARAADRRRPDSILFCHITRLMPTWTWTLVVPTVTCGGANIRRWRPTQNLARQLIDALRIFRAGPFSGRRRALRLHVLV